MPEKVSATTLANAKAGKTVHGSVSTMVPLSEQVMGLVLEQVMGLVKP